MKEKVVVRIDSPQVQAGFLGSGHTARSVVNGGFRNTDPFIFLMDDMLDKKDDEPAGGPHPHAGFETVSLMIEGEIKELLESMKEGDFQVMTAGSGIIHTEPITGPTKGRLLQMWLNLPRKERWVTPRLQILAADRVPVQHKEGVYMRLYSGVLDGVTSPVLNYTPLIVAEFAISPGSEHAIDVPDNFNAFIFVISGGIEIGGKVIHENQVAWLGYSDAEVLCKLKMRALEQGVRLVLYAGKPTGDEIVSYGPFIADTQEEISALYQKFRHGAMEHIADAQPEQKMVF